MFCSSTYHLAGVSLPLNEGYLLKVAPVPCSHHSSAYHCAGASLPLNMEFLLEVTPVLRNVRNFSVRNPGKGAPRAGEGKDKSRVHFELSYVQNASLKRHCHNLTLMQLELDME